MGVVYYANFFVYFESARTDFMRYVGFPYGEMEKKGIFVPVIEAYCRYLSPAYYEDELEIHLWVSEIKNTSFKYSYEVKRGEKLLAKGYTRHVLVNRDMKPMRINEDIKKVLEKYYIEK
jgi:acyl-CoA thioester hydrolase